MSSITKTKKKLVIALLLLMVSVGAYYGLFVHLHTLHTRWDELRISASESAQRTATAQRIEALVRDTAGERAELLSHLLVIDDPTPFLTLVETLGSDVGVTLEVESLTELIPKKDKKKVVEVEVVPMVQVVLHVEGRFDRIYHLLSLLEYMPYVTTVTQVSLTKSASTGVWEGNIYIKVGAQSQNNTSV